MKKLIAFVLAVVALGVVLQIGAVPVIPPVPKPTPQPSPSPGPTPGGGPALEKLQKFEVISVQPILEGYAGGTIDYDVKIIQEGYPDLVVHLTADVPDKWKAKFSQNDFDLTHAEAVLAKVSLSVPELVSAEKYEITIYAVGKAKDDSVEVRASATLTAMTYVVDVGIMNLQLSSLQPRSGENMIITVVAVNYTQRIISNVVVEFLVNNKLVSRQTVTLPAGTSQPVTFGWTAQSGTSTFLVRSQTQGDSNRKNDSVTQKITIGSGIEQVDLLYQQAETLYTQGAYEQARNLAAAAAIQYREMGELNKAAEADRLQALCSSYMGAQKLMDQGEQAFQAENYEQAAQHFEDARNLYIEIGDTEKQNQAQQRLNEALAAQKPRINMLYGIVVIGAVAVILLAVIVSRKRHPAGERQSRLHLEEEPPIPVSRPVDTRVSPTREPVQAGLAEGVQPAELVQFHQKTEDALNRFTKRYIRDNLQQAMQVYLSLEAERKQLPRGKTLELERIIDTNLRELEHRVFGTL